MVRAAAVCALALLGCGGSEDAGAGDAQAADAASTVDAEPTQGCRETGAATGVFTSNVEVRGVDRSYLVSVPEGYDAGTAYPLVFGFHGRTSNSDQARSYFGVEEAAGGAAIVVYPQGLGQNGVPSDTSWDISLDSADLVFFDAMLDAVGRDYCIDRARVFATGHSAGGFMSNHLACNRSAALRAIAPVAGGGPLSSSCDGGTMAAMIIHGTLDTVVMYSLGEGSRDYWTAANGCDTTSEPVEPSPCEAYSGCGAEPVVWCSHDESVFSGHGWPSFAQQGIWPFFARL